MNAVVIKLNIQLDVGNVNKNGFERIEDLVKHLTNNCSSDILCSLHIHTFKRLNNIHLMNRFYIIIMVMSHGSCQETKITQDRERARQHYFSKI